MDIFYYGVNQSSNYKECFRKGLLQKVQPSKNKGKSSIEKAEQWIEEAEKNINSFVFIDIDYVFIYFFKLTTHIVH